MTFLKHLSRRQFLSITATTGWALTATGRGGYAIAQEGTPVAGTAESPVLADQVAAGALPPLADRLPENPMVVKPNESIGKYGGVWRSALVGGSDTAWLGRTVGYDYLVRYSQDWNEVIPNIAEAFEASDDAREYTFKLRKGMKWSDGEPFTVDDIMFYIDDVAGNEELTPNGGGSNPFTGEKIDDVTVKIVFEQPNGLFLTELATPLGEIWTQFPKHYLSQFHKTYNIENLDSLVQETGVANWVELFQTKGGSIPGTPYNAVWSNPELPRLHAWLLTEGYGDSTRVRLTRNPYYWKVDPEGNQLPYIDEVNFDVVQDAEVLLLKAAGGELDMHCRHINTNVNKPVLAENAESGGYRLFDMTVANMNTACFNLNLTHPDPVMREIFQNRDFRIGMSLGLDRQTIIDTIFVSQGEPWQWCPRRDTEWYTETLAKQFTEYDPNLANEYLDKVLPERDGEGWRLRPDGERLTILIDAIGEGVYQYDDLAALAIDNWRRDLGLDVVISTGDRSLLTQRANSNQSDCFIWAGAGGLQDAVLYAHQYLPQSTGARWAEGWYVWYANPSNPLTEPVEPPEPIKQQFDLYDQILTMADPAGRSELFRQLLAIAEEEFWGFGVSLPAPGYGIVKHNFRNIYEPMIDAYYYPTPGPTNPEQYYFDDI